MPSRPSGTLLSPVLDSLLIGGLSLILMAFTLFALDKNTPTNTVAWFAYQLGFLVNFPHFLASYQLLYYENRHRLLKERSLIWAGVAIPLFLIITLMCLVTMGDKDYLAHLAEAMFFLVGWHYVKQIYGSIIITSALSKIFYSNLEKNLLRVNLYSLWMLSWFGAQWGGAHNFAGIAYQTFAMPEWTRTGSYLVTGLTLIVLLGAGFRKYIRDGEIPPVSSCISFITIYAWYIPSLYHPVFFFMIPFFHSLQYLLFVIALQKSKAQLRSMHLPGPEARWQFVRSFYGFLLGSVILGAASFVWIPKYLDQITNLKTPDLGPTIFIFCFYIFINIHHYFIDNVIWTKSNPELGEYLIKPNQPKEYFADKSIKTT